MFGGNGGGSVVAVVLRARAVWVRPAADGDRRQIVDLIVADRLAALFGPAAGELDAWYPGGEVVVAHDGFGVVLGAMALRRRSAVGRLTGGVAWLHCRENPVVAAVLAQAAVEGGAGLAAVTAFTGPVPWAPHLPGLPLHDRPVTTEAFADAGFRTMDQWLLLHRPGRHTAGESAPAVLGGGPPLWIASDGAAQGLPRPVRPAVALAQWREGLLASLEALDHTGGSDALATVDLLAPGASARCHVLEQAGFTEIDLLRSLALT